MSKTRTWINRRSLASSVRDALEIQLKKKKTRRASQRDEMALRFILPLVGRQAPRTNRHISPTHSFLHVYSMQISTLQRFMLILCTGEYLMFNSTSCGFDLFALSRPFWPEGGFSFYDIVKPGGCMVNVDLLAPSNPGCHAKRMNISCFLDGTVPYISRACRSRDCCESDNPMAYAACVLESHWRVRSTSCDFKPQSQAFAHFQKRRFRPRHNLRRRQVWLSIPFRIIVCPSASSPS